MYVEQYFSSFLWDRGPVNNFSQDEGPVPTDLLVSTFQIFLSSYIKLT